MKKYVIFGIKVVAILALISVGYYFFYLKPHQNEVKLASIHYSNLVQNRTAYINLAKLDPSDPSFEFQKSNLVGIIKETNAKGLENPINSEEKRILEAQSVILEKVFATKSYEEGVAILRSEESVQLLADEANLIASLGL